MRLKVDVRVECFCLDVFADVGALHVMALPVDVDESLVRVDSPEVAGVAILTVEDVATGPFRVFATTDMDNDGELCDAGEACAAFSALSLAEVLDVDDDLVGLDFVAAFQPIVSVQEADAR